MAWVRFLLFVLQVNSISMQTSVYDKDEIQALANFYHCLGCGRFDAGTEARAAYADCRKNLPFKLRLQQRGCERDLLPGAELKSDVWREVCRDSALARKIHECVKEKEKSTRLDKEDSDRLTAFKKCAISVDVEFCHAVPPNSTAS